MKKEITAMVVLILLISAAVLNTIHIEALTTDVTRCLERSERAAMRGDSETAMDSYRDALALWQRERDYCNVFIRHSELDSSYDIFYELEEALLSDESDSLPALYSKLKYHMDCIAKMEVPSYGSIF